MSPSVAWKRQPVIWEGVGQEGRKHPWDVRPVTLETMFLVLMGLWKVGGGKNRVGEERVGSGVTAITLTPSSPPHHSQESEDLEDKGRFGSAPSSGIDL